MSEGSSERHSPWLRMVLLGVAFLILLTIGIVTVLVPEISSDPENDATTEER